MGRALSALLAPSLVLGLGVAQAAVAGGSLRFSRALGSHMVLQQAPARANIWGFGAAPGGQVVVTLWEMAGRAVANATATATADGSFAVLLPPQPSGPRGAPTAHAIRAAAVGSSATDATAELVDVLFGEVWLCGGQ